MGVTKSYDYTYSSYSGCDIVASVTIPSFNTKPFVIGELQTVSYSIHREVVPVRTLGRANPKGFTAGTRTVAGSLIFTVFDKNLVHKIVKLIKESYSSSYGGSNVDIAKRMSIYKDRIKDIDSFAVMDEMPPFDITISFMNEYGNHSTLVIKGVVIVDEGQVMSIEDMITENTMSYMATDIQVLKDATSTTTLKPPVDMGRSDTSLASIGVANGIMTPKFDPAITSYVVTLPEGTGAVPAVTASPRDSKSKVTVIPTIVLPGTTRVMVTGSDNRMTRYSIIFRLASENADLVSLMVNGVVIDGFGPDAINYVVNLPYNTRSVPRVTGVAADSRSTIKVDRTYVLPGTTTVTVTADDKVTTKTYTVIFALDFPSSDARLALLMASAGTLSPTFAADVYDYTITMSNGAMPPAISAKAVSDVATVHVTQPTSVPGTATVVVTAQDGVTQNTYNINIE